jgi:uncharacterized protein (TIGR02996 family)
MTARRCTRRNTIFGYGDSWDRWRGPVPIGDSYPEHSRDAALEAAIAANPDDVAVIDVYADWLQQRGAPHGELIAMQRALHEQRDATRFLAARERVETCYAMHGAALGELAGVARHFAVEWRNGFIHHVETSAWRTPVDELHDRFAALLASPVTVGLHTVAVTTAVGEVEPMLAELFAPRPAVQLHVTRMR